MGEIKRRCNAEDAGAFLFGFIGISMKYKTACGGKTLKKRPLTSVSFLYILKEGELSAARSVYEKEKCILCFSFTSMSII